MKLKTFARTSVLAAIMGTTILGAANTAFAATAGTSEASYSVQDTMLKTSDEALAAITQIHKARLELFENKTDDAKATLEAARTDLMTAEATLGDKLMHDFTVSDSTDNYLPFDMSMSLTEGFTQTDENKLALEKAYGLMQTAKPDEAVQVLKLAAIDVNVQAALLPYEGTLTSLDDAIGNIEDGKFFDANIALKSIEDSILVRTFGIDAIPQQGDIE